VAGTGQAAPATIRDRRRYVWPARSLQSGQSVCVRAYARVVRRTIVTALSLYLLFAIIGRFVEGMGAVSCGCGPDCWCKKSVLSTFRWVFPYGHRGYSAEEKAALDSD
jgi:hypothetical protein